MEQSLENKSIIKNRLINFYNSNKLKIYVLIIISVIAFISFIFLKKIKLKS